MSKIISLYITISAIFYAIILSLIILSTCTPAHSNEMMRADKIKDSWIVKIQRSFNFDQSNCFHYLLEKVDNAPKNEKKYWTFRITDDNIALNETMDGTKYVCEEEKFGEFYPGEGWKFQTYNQVEW